VKVSSSSQVQATHPGHPPFHVTRLHRYDHQGLHSILEEEAKWERSRTAPEAASSLIQLRDDAKQSDDEEQAFDNDFLRLSPVQIRGLLEHHAFLQTRQDILALEENRFSPSALMEDPMLVEEIMSYHSDRRPGLHDVYAATGLQSLSSQYIGPIGVGSVLAPSNCTVDRSRPLQFVPQSEAAGNMKNDSTPSSFLSKRSKTSKCHIEDQSQVWVVYDTGSTNIWISSDLCKAGPCTRAGRHRYNHSVSTTFASPESLVQLNVKFGTGKITGPQAVDDFHIGPFTVHNQTFAMIETAEGSVFEEVPFEGIVGLAYPAMSANGAKPFFDTIVEQKALRHNEFAFYFSRDKPAANAVFWGGVDPTFYKGDISYFPVVDPYYWSLKLKSFSIGNDDLMGVKDVPANNSALLQKKSKAPKSGKKSGWNGPFAILDTGTTFFTAEAKKYKEVMSRLPSAKCNEVTDKSHPPITFRLETAAGKDQDFVLTNRQYMTKTGNGTEAKCTTAFMQIDIPPEHGPAMILGEVFLRNFFAVFDRQDGIPHHGRVGLATASHEPDAEARIKDLTKNQAAWHGVTANGELQ